MGMQALENHIGFLKRRCAAMPDKRIRNHLEDTLEQGGLATMQRRKGHTLIALDGTGSFRSRKISCPNCSRQKMADGHQQYVHRMLAATMVACQY